MARVHAVHQWLLPVASITFSILAVLAVADALPWDRPISDWAIDARTSALDAVFRKVSFLGSTPIVLTVAAVAAAAAYRRCPRLAIAIVVIALARPLIEYGLKELIDRERPAGDRLVTGRGPSFPSGHPLATAASWGLLPLVVALYTRRRLLWWVVAASRVWLGVHWTSDVVAALALAILGVAGAERFIAAAHGGHGCPQSARDAPPEVAPQPSSLKETMSARS
jgi:undecaprenyl-diphosphatase